MTFQLEASLADAGAAQRQIGLSVALATRAALGRVGRDMVQRANSKMAAQFDLSRPSTRRRYPGSPRAANALDWRVEGGDTLPLKLVYRVRGGDTVLARIIFMNFGTSGHTISPSGTWPLRTSVSDVLAWNDEDGWVNLGEGVSVQHPGQSATNFLEEARDEAVRANIR